MKQYLTSLHALAGIAALLLIISFFSATLVSEIFASQQSSLVLCNYHECVHSFLPCMSVMPLL